MNRLRGFLGAQGSRVVVLLAILVASGLFLGLAVGFPLSRIQFEESDAVRVDQSQLAGEVDPASALVAQADLPIGWTDGDPALAGFGMLGADFCGESVPLPTTLSEVESAVFADPADDAFLIVQAVRVDRWQSAKSYIDDVASAVGECQQFYRAGPDGSRVQVDIDDGTGEPPITDYVSRRFVAQDGDSVQTWSMMAVGDVVIAMLYGGPARPPEGFLSGLENKVLIRVDPADFAPGGVPPSTATTATTVTVDRTGTSVLEGGAADESDTTIVTPPADATRPGD